MQQIRNTGQNKKAPDQERFFICKSKMVREVDYRWNQIYASIMLMHEKLVKLNLLYVDICKR